MKALIPIGVFGGTFNPIHYGHLRLAQEVSHSLNLREVLFIPSGTPTHRNLPNVSADHRLQMARLATANNPLFKLDECELTPNISGYTVDTLKLLHTKLGSNYSLCLLMGADAFLNLPTWSRWEQLFELAHIIVACRPGYDIEMQIPDALKKHWHTRLQNSSHALTLNNSGAIMLQRMTPLDISASKIRELIKKRESPRYLLPDTVVDYINHHNLYH